MYLTPAKVKRPKVVTLELPVPAPFMPNTKEHAMSWHKAPLDNHDAISTDAKTLTHLFPFQICFGTEDQLQGAKYLIMQQMK